MKILNKKIYLYLTEFFAGMSVMAVEIGASRLLAPYFSSSQIVWTIIIGTIMIAMALGNIFGGRSADKDPTPDKLYKRILVAAIWLAAIPFLGKYVILAICGALVLTVSNNFLIVAAFAACMVIFVFPLFLLGTVTPSLARYTVKSIDDSGKIVGTLGAFNTVGSIIGTFIPTFVSIPAVGTAVTFLIFAGILLILCLVYFISEKRGLVRSIVATILFVIMCILGASSSFAFWQKDLLYEGESVYNYLQVYEDDECISLSTNVLFGVQSVTMKEPGLTGGKYYDYSMLAYPMANVNMEDEADVLILGMGTGTFAGTSLYYYDNLNISGVEIDEAITELADEFFYMPNNINVTNYDGRAYLNVDKNKYDVIMVDAYQDITIPFQMSSLEFFTMVRDHLKDDGVMVVNLNMRSESEDNINYYLCDTIAAAFGNDVYVANVMGYTNMVLYASKSDINIYELEDRIDEVGDISLYETYENVASRLEVYESGDLILTDDKAPVELLGMSVIDELIEAELSYYREIFMEEGISGLLDSF